MKKLGIKLRAIRVANPNPQAKAGQCKNEQLDVQDGIQNARNLCIKKGFGIFYKAKSLVHLINRKSCPLDVLENLSSIELTKQIPPGTFSQPRASKK